MILRSVLQFVNAVILVYLLLLTMKILLTWFRLPYYGRAWNYLCRVTEPYLSLFRGIKFLRTGVFDFTPLAAILTLIVIQNVLGYLIRYGVITLGLFLGIVLRACWDGAVWIMLFFLFLSVVRLAGLYFAKESSSPLWQTVDLMVQPVANEVKRIVKRDLDFRYALVIAIAAFILMWIMGSLLISFLARQLASLPV